MSTVLTEVQRRQVTDNVPLVEHIVNRVSAGLPSSHSRDDLVQNGIVGLISATVRFDPEHGATFASFAGRRIEGAIIDGLRRADWAPRSVRAMERRLSKAEAAAAGPDRSAIELSRRLDIDPAELDRVRADIARSRLDSLDRPVGSEGETQPLSATISNRGDSIEDAVGDQEMIGYLRRGVTLLPERHRVVVIGYFFEGRTMGELGELLGVTQSRASQLKDDALRMLRAGLAKADYESVVGTDDQPRLSGRERAFTAALVDAGPLEDGSIPGHGLSVTG